MKPASFELARPKTVSEVLALLAQNAAEAKLLAGGQTLVPVMNFRLSAPRLLIDLNTVGELAGIRRDGGLLRIGAMTRQAELMHHSLIGEHAPLLAKAVPYIGHVQTRNRGTLGGSLAHADPAAELPLVMVALDAAFVVRSERGKRCVSARSFFRGALATDLASDELLAEVAIPVAPSGVRTSFRELARRHGDFAIVAAAAQRAGERISLAIGGLEAVPRPVDPARVADFVRNADALDDLHASAGYRRTLAAVLIQDCLDEVMA